MQVAQKYGMVCSLYDTAFLFAATCQGVVLGLGKRLEEAGKFFRRANEQGCAAWQGRPDPLRWASTWHLEVLHSMIE